jgi:hypothetical protein
MVTIPARIHSRTMTLLALAAFAAAAFWFAQPWRHVSSALPGFGTDAPMAAALHVDGQPQVDTQDGIVRHLVVPVVNDGGESIDFTDARLRAETVMGEGAAAAVPADYSITWSGGRGDNVLRSGEQATLDVTLPAKTSVYPDNPLALVFTTPDGQAWRIDVIQ